MSNYKSYDYLISASIFLLSLVGSALTYAHILNSVEEKTFVSNSFLMGKSSYEMFVNDKCVGDYIVSLETLNNGFVYSANGSFRALLKGSEITPTFTVDAQFNSIGQLGASISRITLLGGFISLGTSDISPINSKIRIDFGDMKLEHSLRLPGPIELKREGGDRYFVEYKAASILLPNSQALIAQPLLKQIAIEIRQKENGAASCSGPQSGQIDFDALINGLQMLTGNIASLGS